MKKTIIALLALSLASPALAMAKRPVDPSTQPVPAGQRDALYDEYGRFTACLGDPRFSQVRGRSELVELETALNTAGAAAKNSNNGQFQIERDRFYAELAPLKVRYGC